ncbi:hypothetical protein [Paenibacillus odorifer]|uniref:hypothetical protein n=1 Tax=Paenibacillus odorifer TaxID=189426 RepID=UPI002DB9B0D1|nr:hypothetical protein [Paenibacillus odorifer]MEC0131489.1 hypothetical protein [Paenibacillus odorifer]MEC0220358.1 hypothetical protein [Paenibacillus odorifer]
MLIDKDISEVKQVDDINEVNKLINIGWALLETGSKVVNDETVFFFLLGKTSTVTLNEIIQVEELKMKNVIPLRPES